jgi:hypothetical protein
VSEKTWEHPPRATTYYRFDTHSYNEHSGQFYADTYQVVRFTPAGCWLNVYGEEKFVLSKARKKFAHPTKELALESFIARKVRQIDLLELQLGRVKVALIAARKYDLSDPKPLLLNYEPYLLLD